MIDDAIQRILGLVSDGRLSVAEAGPILDALDGRAVASPTPAAPPGEQRQADRATDHPATDQPSTGGSPGPGRGGRALRIQVTDHGRSVVDMRVPIALGRTALARIPGLSEATGDRIREAIEAGITGPIVAIDDGDDSVRIVIE